MSKTIGILTGGGDVPGLILLLNPLYLAQWKWVIAFLVSAVVGVDYCTMI